VRAATEAVHRTLPEADVLIQPSLGRRGLKASSTGCGRWPRRHNVSVHELSVQSHLGRLRVEQHLELDETLTLLKAHDFVCAMEAEILREVPEIDGVRTAHRERAGDD